MKSIRVVLVITIFITAAIFFAITISFVNEYRQAEVAKMAKQSQNMSTSNEKFLLYQKIALLSPSEENYLKAGAEARNNGYQTISEIYLKRVKSAPGLYQLGLVYFERKEYQLAEKAFQRAATKEQKEEYRESLAKTKLYQGKFREGISDCDKSKKYNLTCATLYLAIIDLTKLTPEYLGEEIEVAEIARVKDETSRNIKTYRYLDNEINPQASSVYLENNSKKLETTRDGLFLLGNYYFNKNNYQKAAEYLESARRIDPLYPQVYKHLIDVYKKLGNNELVIQHTQKLSEVSWN